MHHDHQFDDTCDHDERADQEVGGDGDLELPRHVKLINLVKWQTEDHSVHYNIGYPIGAQVEDVGVDTRADAIKGFPVITNRCALEDGGEHDSKPPGARHRAQSNTSPLHEACGKDPIVHSKDAQLDEGKAGKEEQLAAEHVLFTQRYTDPCQHEN